jgi:UDP-N-acetylglucosamine:LPS N-acetylglucosamine transferase
MAMLARLPLQQIRSARVNECQMMGLRDSAGRIQQMPFYIDDSSALTVQEVSARTRRLMIEVPELALVIVDYLQLMVGVGKHNNREQEVSEISRGIKQLAKELGIPIESKFLERYNKNALFEKFRLDKGKFTVLIATGSFGIGPIEAIVDSLYKDVQILAVCARNRRLYKRLKNKNYPKVRVFGYVDNIEELMAISDIIITKPGGLAISESLAMDLLPIFISAIPGQETQNLKILAHYGIGIYPKDTAAIKRIVMDYKEHPDKLRSARENISKIKKLK